MLCPGRFSTDRQNRGRHVDEQFWEQDTGGKFDVTIQLPNSDARLRPGLTAQIVIRGEDRKNALYIPRQALFLKDGKRVVYVKSGNGFEQREVKIQNESESRAAIEGSECGQRSRVGRSDRATKSGSSGAPSGIGGGTP